MKPLRSILILSGSLLILLAACQSGERERLSSGSDEQANDEFEFQNLYQPSSPVPELREKLDGIDFIEDLRHETVASEFERTTGVVWDDLQTPNRTTFEPPPTDVLQMTWLGHAGFLIQWGPNVSILIDPVLGEFDGAPGLLRFVKPELRRISNTTVAPADLPSIDAVLVSHNHYDHLNWWTLDRLTNSSNTPHLVPLGVEREFPGRYQNVIGMGWYTSTKITDDVTVHFVPAHHRSQRFLFDKQQTLWGGFVIENGDRRLYFAGDTAFSPIFEDIRDRLGPMEVCLMPIISYQHGIWHMSPEEALVASEQLGCKHVVPWGYGTFLLSPEHVYEPVRRLQAAVTELQPSAEVMVMKQGESFRVTPRVRDDRGTE